MSIKNSIFLFGFNKYASYTLNFNNPGNISSHIYRNKNLYICDNQRMQSKVPKERKMYRWCLLLRRC